MIVLKTSKQVQDDGIKKEYLPYTLNFGKIHKLLAKINQSRSDVFACNIVNQKHLENYSLLIYLIQACLPCLKAQLQVFEPKIIIILGRLARSFLFPKNILVNTRVM